MIRKFVKTIAVVSLLSIIGSGTACAGKAQYNFLFANSGKEYNTFSKSVNRKTIASNPWTLNVDKIFCGGANGVRFAPAKKTGAKYVACAKSAVWRKTKGYGLVKYSAGDAKLTDYKLAARVDDDYIGAYSNGWWNADKLNP